MTVNYILIAILLVCSAYFSGTEMAFTSLNRKRLDKLAEEKGGVATRAAVYIHDRFNRTLSSLLIGNNLVNIWASSVATLIAMSFGTTEENDAWVTVVATSILTVIILIFGEIIPKVVAKQHSLGFARAAAIPLFVFMIIIAPIAVPVSAAIEKLGKLWAPKEEIPEVTEEELATIIDTAEEEEVIDEDKSELLRSALEFPDTSLEEIITPRIDMTALDVDDDMEKQLEIIMQSNHSRLPVYEDTVDHVIGIISVTHLLRRLAEGEDVDLRRIMIEPLFLHKTMKLPAALAELRQRQLHMAIVLDEYGGTLGIVTMEDILEEIVGDIWDETDEICPDFIQTGENSYEVNGGAGIFDLFDHIDFDARHFESECTTVGGWVTEQLDGDPQPGDSFDYENLYFIVTEMGENRVLKVSVVIRPTEENEEE